MSSTSQRVQLYLCNYQREYVLRLTTAYIQGSRDRLLISEDYAKEKADQTCDEFMEGAQRLAYDDPSFSIVEDAYAHGLAVYDDLMFLRSQLIGLSIAGLYHLWERLIKRFITAELRQGGADVTKEIAKWVFSDICDALTQFGFAVRDQPFYSRLNQLRLVANAVKHGSGSSWDQLREELPELSRGWKFAPGSLIGFEYDEPEFNETHLENLSKAVVEFWEALPERLFLVE